MTRIENLQIITANDTYILPGIEIKGGEAILEWGISAGTATVTPGYVDVVGNFQAFRQADGSAFTFDATGGSLSVDVPSSRLLAVKVEAAAALSMKAAANLSPLRP